MSHVIGIDLGTTNSCVAANVDGDIVVIANQEGGRTTPSVFALMEGEERLVGQLAKRQAVTNPTNTVVAAKRLIGLKYDNPEVEHARFSVGAEIIKAENGDAWIRIQDKEYSPEQISSFILAKMKETAQDFFGEEITEAIITVPAHFDDTQRQATKDAGRLAGLDVLRIINEPTAAALAYGVQESGEDGVYVVYDLGGGTFDVTILEVQEGVFEVLSTSGDTMLGGEDFDVALIKYLVELFEEDTGVSLLKDTMAMQRLKEAAEKTKHELSTANSTEINLPFIAANAEGPVHLIRTIQRAEFESLVAPLVERTLGPCKDALNYAEIEKDEITEVILVGGMTRMPLVQEKVTAFFNKEPSQGVNPDEVVAVGAATQGGVMTGEVTDVILLDVTPLTLGVETSGGRFTPLISRNSTIPISVSEVFTTAVDNQDFVRVHILQGERPLVADNKSLATFDFVDIPPAPRGEPQIEVSFHIDADGMVEVTAKDLATGREQAVQVQASGGLSEDEISELISEAEDFSDRDALKKERVEFQNRIIGLIYTSERTLGAFGDTMNKDELEAIEELLELAKDASEDDSIQLDSLEEVLSELEQTAYRLAEIMAANMEDI